ncbi:MAG: glutamyl-tRNA reductase [Dehalococcoidales bacterium]|nr:glutamyl-tRNA reductase [Dehalococcoidales bacterium]
MRICVIGVNHRTAPVEVREKAAIRSAELAQHLSLLHNHAPCGIILSTCNRTEVYIAENDGRDVEKTGLKFFQTYLNIPDDELTRCAYVITNQQEVAKNLYRITCGLDSLIIGEYEILGQVGNALEAAEKSGMVNLLLRHLFQGAIRAGRRVREETGISKNALSVSSVAVELAAQIIPDLSKSRLLVIGTGEAGRLVAKASKERGVTQIAVASRTLERAAELADLLGGKAVDMYNLFDELGHCDIVVGCASSPHALVDAARIESVMKGRPAVPLVIIDIAVPRNVADNVKGVNNVFLYNIDDLTEISEANRKLREVEISRAESIIREELEDLNVWWHSLESRPAVTALMEKAEAIRSAQLNSTLKKLRPLTQEENDYLEAMTKSIVVKLLKDPVHYLKNNAEGDGDGIELIRQLFRLEVEKPE